MKILRSGITDPPLPPAPVIKKPEIFQGECPRCGCLFQCERWETCTVEVGNYREGGTEQVVKCPECNKKKVPLKII